MQYFVHKLRITPQLSLLPQSYRYSYSALSCCVLISVTLSNSLSQGHASMSCDFLLSNSLYSISCINYGLLRSFRCSRNPTDIRTPHCRAAYSYLLRYPIVCHRDMQACPVTSYCLTVYALTSLLRRTGCHPHNQQHWMYQSDRYPHRLLLRNLRRSEP